jgi:hypothetical protein
MHATPKRPTLTPQRHPPDTAKGRSPRTSAPDTSEVSAVDGYQGPTEIPAGADDERDFEAEAVSLLGAASCSRLATISSYSGVPVSCADQFALELSETTD